MTPPGTYRNFILGRTGIVSDHRDLSGSVTQLQTLARLSTTTQASARDRRSDTAMRLLVQGTTRSSEAIADEVAEHDDATVRQAFDAYSGLARGGDRTSYYHAMRASFILAHRSLNTPEGRAQIPTIASEFRQISREYQTFLTNNADLSPELRLRYLFAASVVIRNMIGRLSASEESRTAAGGELDLLRTHLRETYDALLGHYQQHLIAHPNGEGFPGILREIQMRQAILAGDNDTARQRALELTQSLTAHPPPAEDPDNEGTQRWDYVAARNLLEDTDFAGLVRGMDAPSTTENSIALVNGVSLELLQTACAALDQINEDGEATITARYRSLATVMSVLTLTRPSSTLSQLLDAMQNSQETAAILGELEGAAHDSVEIQRLLTESRGSNSLSDYLNTANDAARHVQHLRQTSGRNILNTILTQNSDQNPIHDLADLLSSHAGLLASLGMETSQRSNPLALQHLATDLLRRGELGRAAVQEYATAHPNELLPGILNRLQEEDNPSRRVNDLAQQILSSYENNLSERPDHEVSVLHALFQLIGQTHEITTGVSFEAAVTNQANSLSQRIEGTEFRVRRVFAHLRSPSSVTTLAAGVMLSEMLPAALVYRAGTSGRLAAPVLGTLVRAGRLTTMGSIVTGLGTGLAMSTIGSLLNSSERARLGLRNPHPWRDWAESVATNAVVFGTMIPLSRGFSNWLSPAAQDATAIGRLSRVRQLTAHGLTAFTGGTLALGAGTIWRRIHTGQWHSPSFEEVAENYLSILEWEASAAGLRRFRTRFGLRAELEGRPHVRPIMVEARPRTTRASQPATAVEVPARTSVSESPSVTANPATGETNAAAPTSPRTPGDMFRAFLSGLRPGRRPTTSGTTPATPATPAGTRPRAGARLISLLGNVFFTQLGPHRAARINTVTSNIVEGNPQLASNRDFIVRQLAYQELSAPGSLDQFTDGFLSQNRGMLDGRLGNTRLVFRRPELIQLPAEGYSESLVAAMRRHHVDNSASTDADYLPRFMPNNPYDVVEVRVNPRTGRIVGINTHSLGNTEGSILLHGSYDPQTQQLRLPPVGLGETTPQVVDLHPMIAAHRTSSSPLLWTENLGQRVLPQRINSTDRARVRNAIDVLNRDHDVTILFNAETGELLTRLMAEGGEAATNIPDSILTLRARYNAENKTLTFPAPRGTQGEYVYNTETGRFEIRLPEPSSDAPAASTSPTRTPSRTRSTAASASDNPVPDEVPASAAPVVADLPQPRVSELMPQITDRRVDNRHVGILRRARGSEPGASPVTVYFSGRTGRILGINSGHTPNSQVPEFTISDHLNASGNVPRNRLSLQGTLDEAQDHIVLEVPASEGQEAGTLTINLRSLNIRFARNPTPPSTTGGPDGTPPPSTDGSDGTPPAANGGTPAPSGASEASPSTSSASDITGPQAAILPNHDVHSLLPIAEVLGIGESRMAVEPNIPGSRTREGQHWAIVPGLGEVSAFTEVGFSKHSVPRNEDAYGFRVDHDGNLIAVIADGAGGSSTGDAASGRAVRFILSRANEGAHESFEPSEPLVSLGRAFHDAHRAILSDLVDAIFEARTEIRNGNTVLVPEDSYTVATGLRLKPDGSAEFATVGDTQLWIARPNADGVYDVLAPYLPANMPGLFRAAGAPGHHSTVEMNAAHGDILAQLGGRPGAPALPIRNQLESGLPTGIFNSDLTLPAEDGSGARTPFTAQHGDLFLLMTDGIHTLFNRNQMAETLQGLTSAETARRAVQSEVSNRLDLYRNLSAGLPRDRRAVIGSGYFEGNFIDNAGRIYDAATGGNLVGNVNPDNVGLVVVRFDPTITAPAGTAGSGPEGNTP